MVGDGGEVGIGARAGVGVGVILPVQPETAAAISKTVIIVISHDARTFPSIIINHHDHLIYRLSNNR
jgi:hypothetical protein